MNCGIAAGCGAASSWGRAVVGCAAAEESRLPTECAGDALAQLVGSEPDGKRRVTRQANINLQKQHFRIISEKNLLHLFSLKM
jgi:hypothetical protein